MSLSGENGTQLTMPVMPAGMGGYGGMGGFGMDGWWGILFIIAIMCGGWGGFGGFGGMGGLMGMWPFLFGGFGNGWGNGGGSAAAQGALTREQACIDNNFNNLARTVEGIAGDLRGLNSTICHQEYETAGLVNGLGNIVQQGFSQAELSRCSQQAALMQMLYQMSTNQQDCCCQTKQAISQVNYDAAMRNCETNRLMERGFCDINYANGTNTNAIIQNAHNDADRIIARFDAFERNQDKETIANLRQQLQDARFQASQVAQNGAIQGMVNASTAEILHRSGHDCPSAAYIVQPPTPVTFQTNGCGQAVFAGNGYGGCCNG